MRTGSLAMAMAVLTSTASAPSSIASAAWLGAPSAGIDDDGDGGLLDDDARSGRGCRCRGCEPMGEPSGMTVAVPASWRRLASTGSALM